MAVPIEVHNFVVDGALTLILGAIALAIFQTQE